jgi:CRISPR-associated endonuclease Cas2
MAACKKYLICYDIGDRKRLQRVYQTLRDHGVPVQRSVFEAELGSAQLDALLKHLESVIQSAEDRISFYSLTLRHEKTCLGLQDIATASASFEAVTNLSLQTEGAKSILIANNQPASGAERYNPHSSRAYCLKTYDILQASPGEDL